MPKFVVFTSNNARIVHADSPIDLHGMFVLENPDLSAVKGVPPHHWKVGPENKVLPMDFDEKESRDSHIRIYGADNTVTKPKPKAPVQVVEPKEPIRAPAILTWAMIAIVLFVILGRLILPRVW